MHRIVFRFDPGDWISDVSGRYDLIVRVMGSRPSGENGMTDLVEISSSGGNIQDVVGAISGRDDVTESDLAVLGNDRAVGVVVCTDSPTRRRIAGLDLFLDTAKIYGSERMVCVLLTSSEDVVNTFLNDLSGVGDVVMISRIENEIITPRDLEVIRAAFRSGFYEYPKRAGLRDLARMLGTSSQSVAGSLRNAQRKILECYLMGVKMKR